MNLKVLLRGSAHLFIKRYTGSFWIRRSWLNKTQWFSASELEEIQLKLLQRLVRHCYSTVPYYRRLMHERGIRVESIRTLKDIKQFPILSKKDVLRAGDSIVSTKYPRWLMRTARTGGTTGTPLKICRSLSSIGNEHAFVRRQWDWADISLADRTAWIAAGRRIAKPDQTDKCLYAYEPFMKELSLSAFHLSPKTAIIYAEAIKRYHVKAIDGISSAIHLIARVIMDSGIKVKLKAALTTSETLTDAMKKTISEAFDCKVFDHYGAAERVCDIHTCEHGSYHIISEYGLTEFLPIEDEVENQYKIVATGFWNLGMPLIRYDTCDIIEKSDIICACGRAYPVVKSISGRQSDIIRTPSGREYGPTYLARVVKEARNIMACRIVQDALNHIRVEFIPGRNFVDDDLAYFKKHLLQLLPSELEIDLKQVDAIPKTRSGKTKLIISRI